MGLLDFFRMANPDYKPAPHGGGGLTVGDLLSAGDLEADVAALQRAVAELQWRVAALEGRGGHRAADQSRWYHPADFAGSPAPDLATWTAGAVPFVSTLARISGELTSTAFAKQTWGDAGLFTVIGGLIGGGVAIGAELPWTLAPAGAAVAFCLSGAVLVAHRRALLHKVVSQQGRGGKRREELHITIATEDGDRLERLQLLMVAGITAAQVKEFAQRVIDGAGLQVKSWSGRGALFSEAQYTALMVECERFNFVKNAGGNVGRYLTPTGKRMLAKMAGECS